MLTSQKVIDAINEQIGCEFSAELQYYAAHFAAEALPQLSQHFSCTSSPAVFMHRKRLMMHRLS
jgi:ferritin